MEDKVSKCRHENRRTRSQNRETRKENEMSNFISDRVSEGSTHQGVIVAVAACAVLFGGIGLTQVILYGALAWGVWSMLKKD